VPPSLRTLVCHVALLAWAGKRPASLTGVLKMAWAGKMLQFASDVPGPVATLDDDEEEDKAADEVEDEADDVAEDEAAPEPDPIDAPPPPPLPPPPQAARAAMIMRFKANPSGLRMAPSR
jgi:hypothetical protein